MSMKLFPILGVAIAIAAPTVTHAATFTFSSSLDSAQASSAGASAASGGATLSVDDTTETLSFALTVSGISIDQLADAFVDGANAALGPIHLHDGDFGLGGPVVVPFVFNTTYAAVAGGFEVNVMDYAYADAVAISGSTLSFDEYLADLQRKGSYINVHTDDYASGEIRGQFVPDVAAVPLPAGMPLLLAGLGGLAMVRRRNK